MPGSLSLCLLFVVCACLSVDLSRALHPVKRLLNPRSRLWSALPSGTPPTDPYSYARDTESRLATQLALGIATMKEAMEKNALANKEAMEKNALANKEAMEKNALENKEATEMIKKVTEKSTKENKKATDRALIISGLTLLAVASLQPEIRTVLFTIFSKFVKV